MTARHILLYQWWKDVRPKRPDPWHVSGLSAYYEKEKEQLPRSRRRSFLDNLNENEPKEEIERLRNLREICDKMNRDYEEEDTQMLIRLVELRGNIWT